MEENKQGGKNVSKKPFNVTTYIVGVMVVALIIKCLFLWIFPPIKQLPIEEVAPTEFPQLHFDDLKPIELER